MELVRQYTAQQSESAFETPVIDQTRLTNRYDIDLNWNETDYQHPNLESLKQALLDQLGLELVPTNMPIEMLVVGKIKWIVCPVLLSAGIYG